MPTTTRYGRISSIQSDYSIRGGFILVGSADERLCILPTNRYSNITLAELNISGQSYTEKNCILHSFVTNDVRIVCPGASTTYYGQRRIFVATNVRTSFSVINTNVGDIAHYDVNAVVHTHIITDQAALAIGTDSVSSERICLVPIAAETTISILPVSVPMQIDTSIQALAEGELYSTVSCSIVTITETANIACMIHGAAEIDYYHQIQCCIPRLVGTSVEYATIEVLLGERSISDLHCVTEVPIGNYTDRKCTTSCVLDGEPHWNRFVTKNHIFVRLRNIGRSEVTKAVLQDSNSSIEADKIQQLSSMWQIRFKRDKTMSHNYVIVITLEPGSHIVVVDQSQSDFSI